MKKEIIAGVLSAALITGCVTTSSNAPVQGAALGTVVGGSLGAVIDKKNPWRGAVIGGAAGAVLGGGLTAISARASREAASSGKAVTYRTENGEVVRAEPVGDFRTHTTCRKVRERIWKNGKVIKDQIKEVCEGVKESAEY